MPEKKKLAKDLISKDFALYKKIDIDEMFVREQVAKALGEIGDKRAIEPLKVLLNDKNKDVHKAAKESLEKILKG